MKEELTSLPDLVPYLNLGEVSPCFIVEIFSIGQTPCGEVIEINYDFNGSDLGAIEFFKKVFRLQEPIIISPGKISGIWKKKE